VITYYATQKLRNLNAGQAAHIYNPTTHYGVLLFEEPVRNLRNNAFTNQSNLISVELPDSIISIGTSAFSGCSSLREINIPEGVTTLQNNTF